MNVDIYRRSEPGNKLSYLIVPSGQPIPEEATNVDWQSRRRDVHVDDAVEHLHPYDRQPARADPGEGVRDHQRVPPGGQPGRRALNVSS